MRGYKWQDYISKNELVFTNWNNGHKKSQNIWSKVINTCFTNKVSDEKLIIEI